MSAPEETMLVSRLRATLASLGEGVVTTDTHGVVVELNPEAERLTGWTGTEARGQPLETVFSLLDERTATPLTGLAQTVLRHGAVVGGGDTVLVARDGTRRPVAHNAAPIRDEAGTIQGVALVCSDQTAQQTAQRALRASEERLRLALAAANQGLYDLDLQTGECVVSPEYARLLGEDPASFRESYPAWEARLHPDDRPTLRQAFAEYLAGQRVEHRVEYRQQTVDGQWKWLLSVGRLVARSADGRPLRLLGTHTDISARKHTEEALRDSLREKETLLHIAMDGFCLMDQEGRFLEVNEAFGRLTGYERTTLLGRTLTELDPEDATTGAAALLDRFRQAGAAGCEWRLTRRDGQRIDVELSVNWLPHAGGRWFCFLRDITERKRAVEWLSLQSAALEAAANAIVITDPAGTILWANAAFAATTGYARDEMRGRNPRDLVRSGQQDDAFYRAMWETIRSGEVWQGEIVNRRKDGSLYPADLSITPLRNARGEVTHFIAIQQDLTRRKELEARFRQAQKMQALGQLAGGVAHDFNNLLSVILMHTGLLRASPGLSDNQADELAHIAAAAERAANLTRRLLTFGRRATLHPEPWDLNEVVTSLSQMLRRLIGETIELRTLLPPGGAPLLGDRGLLEQVLLNLVINARDAMPQGGQLTIELSERTLDAGAVLPPEVRPGRFVRLSVRDTGHGIAPEHRPHLFEPFFTTKPPGQGTGLGLATVYGIVEQHRGWIEVDSQVGQGTTFHVHLPRLAAGSAPAPTPAPAEPSPRPGRGTETILVAEDEPGLLSVTSRILKRAGYRVLEAPDGNVALALGRHHAGAVDLLLTDLVMSGGLSGRHLAEQLHAEQPRLKVLYMSGHSDEVAGHDLALREGVNFLQKPFASAHLLATLRACLDDQPADASHVP
jgi:PAS domain S-box-containing protein